MKVTYIHHSGFLIELEYSYLLIDYTEGSLPPLDEKKPLLVLASHRHGDHFSDGIFALNQKGMTRYVLSSDIKRYHPGEVQKDAIYMVKPREEITLGLEAGFDRELRIETLKSTDEGVAFLISSEGHSIYHAGDLNHWFWKGEPDSWNKNMQVNYRREIETLAGREIDVAFLPLDPRLEEYFYLGVDDFMRQVGAKHVFPMHLWGDFGAIGRLKALPESELYRDKIIEIQRDGEIFPI